MRSRTLARTPRACRHLFAPCLSYLLTATALFAGASPDRQALIDFYNATGGPGWANNSGWLGPAGTECSWSGVTCNGSMRVTSLRLAGNQLQGTLPNLNLPELTFLELFGNDLSGPIPDFSNLPALTSLQLGFNSLSGSIPDFSGMPALANLVLWNNNLSGPIPDFSNLPQLDQLLLGFNNLSGTIPDFSGIPLLGWLMIAVTDVSGSVPNFSNLPQLTALDLYSNNLSGPIPNFSLPQLLSLSMTSNNLSGTIPDFSGLPSLIDLFLDDNNLGGSIPNFSLPQLRRLDLGDNSLTGTVVDFGGLPNLEFLRLRDNNLSGTVPNFSNLSQLTTLNLAENSLAGSIPNFSNLPQLGTLWLEGNALSGPMPDLSGLPLSFAPIGYNALYADSDPVATFWTSVDSDWQQTQTVPPDDFAIQSTTDSTATLTWSPIPYTSDTGRYVISSATSSGGPYTVVGSTASKANSELTVTGLAAETTYYFVVTTQTDPHGNNSNALESEPSIEVMATTDSVTVVTAALEPTCTDETCTFEAPATVQFSDLSTGPIEVWRYDFSNRSANGIDCSFGPDRSSPVSSFTYTAGGTYYPCLLVEAGDGASDGFVFTTGITIVETEPAVTVSCAPDEVSLGQASTCTALPTACEPGGAGWNWQVGDAIVDGESGGLTIDLLWLSEGAKSVSASHPLCGDAVGTTTVTVNDAPSSCQPGRVLSCTQPIDVHTTAGGSSEVDAYSCARTEYPGPEVIYSFAPTVSGEYLVELSELEADLDLVVMGPDGCDPGRCLSFSDASGTGDESAAFLAEAGSTYSIAVDSVGAPSGYTLSLTCPEPPDASFELSPSFPTAGQAVRFFDTSAGSSSSEWNFGDGAAASGRAVNHTFAEPGAYGVSLTASNAAGTATVVTTIAVASPDAEIFVGGIAVTTVDRTEQVSGSASGCSPDPSGWTWGTAGGVIDGPDDTATISVSWPSSGTRVVTATNRACGSASGTREIDVAPAVAASPPQPPAAPTLTPISSTELLLTWEDTAEGEEGFAIDFLDDLGQWQEVGFAPANSTEVVVPADPLLVAKLPEAVTQAKHLRESLAVRSGGTADDERTFRVRAVNSAGEGVSSNASILPSPESCVTRLDTMCLQNKRFEIQVAFRDPTGRRANGQAVALTQDTGYFWFFTEDNVELIVKVLDAVGINDRYWVFYGSLTDVEFTLTVTDTETGFQSVYFNPLGVNASRADVDAIPGRGARGNAGIHALFEDGTSTPVSVDVAGASGPLDQLGFDWQPQPGRLNRPIQLVDNDPTEETFRNWDFGDGSPPATLDGPIIDHRYRSVGRFTATLSRSSSADSILGRTFQVSQQLEVVPGEQPAIRLTGRRTVTSGDLANFSATANHCHPSAQGWNWSVDNGVVLGDESLGTIQVQWSGQGQRTIEVSNPGCPGASALTRVTVEPQPATPPPPVCVPDSTTLCLSPIDPVGDPGAQDNRFEVQVSWADSRSGDSGEGNAFQLTRAAGYFWFFDENNVEVMIKVLDGRSINDFFWVFTGALSDVEYTLRVRDVVTGAERTFVNPQGQLESLVEIEALEGGL